MIRRWISELMAEKSIRKLLQLSMSETFSWTCYYDLHHLHCTSHPGAAAAVPAISMHYSTMIYQLPTILSVNILRASQLAFTTWALCWVMFTFLSARNPDAFLPRHFLVSWTYPILCPSISYRLFGEITCHKPPATRQK